MLEAYLLIAGLMVGMALFIAICNFFFIAIGGRSEGTDDVFIACGIVALVGALWPLSIVAGIGAGIYRQVSHK